MEAFAIRDMRLSDTEDAEETDSFQKQILYDKNRRVLMVIISGEGFGSAQALFEEFKKMRENCSAISYSLMASLKHRLGQVDEKKVVAGSMSLRLMSDYVKRNTVIYVEYLNKV